MGQDEVVVERSWRSGVEIVARVNWSQIARVRRALGLCDMAHGTPLFPIRLASAGVRRAA